MKVKRFSAGFLALVLAFLSIGAAPIRETELLRDREPNWFTHRDYDRFTNIPRLAPFSTGFYSTAISNQIDFNQPRVNFEGQALQYVAEGFIEVFHENAQTIPVSYARVGNQSRLLDEVVTGVAAFDQYRITLPIGLDIAHGQWLINNNVVSRFNDYIHLSGSGGVHNRGSLEISPLDVAPWGIQHSTTAVSRDEFVIGLARAAFGPIESRPILIRADAYRYAQAGIWRRQYICGHGLVPCVFSHYSFVNERVGTGQGGLYERFANTQHIRTPRQTLNNFHLQRVSETGTYRSAPSVHNYGTLDCGRAQAYGGNRTFCTGQVVFRGEFSTSPENFTHPVFHVYNPDYWSYVSINVWELYLFQMLTHGILDYDELFTLESSDDSHARLSHLRSDLNLGPRGDTFQINTRGGGGAGDLSLRDQLREEFRNYGISVPGVVAQFPLYAPELGVVVDGQGFSIRDVNIREEGSTGVLGRNYSVSDTGIIWNSTGHRNDKGLPTEEFFQYQQMTVISALRLIERIMRVQEDNMSDLEAQIIVQRYGAKMLDNIPAQDRRTVQFLIAQGIINFENFEEYADLYSVLSREFAYTLLFRLANPAARSHFSQVLITDIASMMMPGGFLNYQNSVRTNMSSGVDSFISQDGRIVLDALSDIQHEIGLASDIFLDNVRASAGMGYGLYNPIFIVTLNIDDPLRYLYRGFPLVLSEYSYLTSSQVSVGWSLSSNAIPANYIPTRYSELSRDSVPRAHVFHNERDLWGHYRNLNEEFLQVFPDNMLGSRDPRVATAIADFRWAIEQRIREDNPGGIGYIDGSRGGRPIIDFRRPAGRGGDLPFWPMGVNSLNLSDPTGVVSVRRSTERIGRYLVEISIAAVCAESAVTFVLTQMSNLAQGVLPQHSEVASAISENSGTLLVDSRHPAMTGGVTLHGNVARNRFGNTFFNENVGISGTSIIQEQMRGTAHNVDMVPAAMTHLFSPSMVVDSVGSQQMLNVQHPNLHVPNFQTFHQRGRDIGTARARTFVVTDNPVTERFLNLSTANLGDRFTTQREVRFVWEPYDMSPSGVIPFEMTVPITILVEFELHLPTPQEQSVMVSNEVSTDPRSADLLNWIYTRPSNPHLQEFWDYNIAVSNAIMQAFGLPDNTINSGFLVPNLTFIVDWLPGTEQSLPQNEEQRQRHLRNIANSFLTEVGIFIPMSWQNTFLGTPVVFNRALDTLTDEERQQLVGQGFIEPAGVEGLTRINISQTGSLDALVSGDIPLWAAVYFEFIPAPGQIQNRWFHTRLTTPTVDVMYVLRMDGPNRLFGHVRDFAEDVGGEESISYEEIRFALSSNNDLYMHMSLTDFIHNEGSSLLIHAPESFANLNLRGQTVRIGDYDWIIVDDDGREIMLASNRFTVGSVSSDGRLVDRANREDLVQVTERWVLEQLNPLTPPQINVMETVSFMPFDTTIYGIQDIEGEHIAEIANGELVVSRVAISEGISVRIPATNIVGLSVYYRPFVRLNRSVWNISPGGEEVIWSPGFLGADPRYYNPQNNLLMIQSAVIPNDSDNLISLEELGQTSFEIGNLTAFHIGDGEVLLRVPFSDEILDRDGNVNLNVLTQALLDNSEPVVVGDNVFNTADYVTHHGIAAFNTEYQGYNNTLVLIGDLPTVITADGEARPLTPNSVVNDVSLSASLDPATSIIAVRNVIGAIDMARMNNRQQDSPRLRMTQRSYFHLRNAVPIANVGVALQDGRLEVAEVPLYLRELIRNFNMLRIQSGTAMIVWWIVVAGLVLSVFILLARVLRHIPITHDWSENIRGTSGIDVLAIMSITLVKTEDEPIGWGVAALWSATFAILPMLVVALLQGFGVILL